MKSSIIRYALLLGVTVLMGSCDKDEVQTVMQTGVAPQLSASASKLTLTADKAGEVAQIMTWKRADYGFKAAVSYTLESAKSGTNFASPKEVVLGNGVEFKYTTAELNQLAVIMGLKPAAVGKIDFRVKAVISPTQPPLYSNVQTIDVTPYQVVINYPSLWVPGAYQGWNATKAPKISSTKDNSIYEGYVNFIGADLNFKLTSHPDWNNKIYGWASSMTTGSDVTGTFNTTGGNLFVPETGYYLVKANTIANTWSATKTTWSIIGNAPTLSNNWTNDVPLIFDPANNTWKVTTTFTAGNFKFRANGAWVLNFGDTGADLSLEYDGANIAIPAAGTYTVTLDLKAGNYTYTIQ